MERKEEAPQKSNGFDFKVPSPQSENKQVSNIKDAMLQLEKMMERKEYLNIRFNTDKKDAIPYAWIESKGVDGFPMKINNDNYHWLLDYVMNGPSDFKTEVDDMSVEVEPLPNADIQWNVLKALIEAHVRIQYVPSFRLQKDKIAASAKMQKGMIMFYLDRTEERMDYLAEMKQTI